MSRRVALLLCLALVAVLLEAYSADGFFQFQQQQPPRRKPKRAEVDYYKILGLEEKREAATEKEIKQSFRQLSRQLHPDVAKTDADRKRYSEVNRAYEVLSDKRKRKMYDMRGEAGLEMLEEQQAQGNQGGGNPLAQMFGFAGGGDGLRGPDAEMRMEFDLRYFFTGGETEVRVTKQKVCAHCKGQGAEPNSPMTACPQCGGQGMLRQRVQFGPGMVQEFQQVCPACQGAGKRAKNACHVCHGNRVVRGEAVLNVELERGTPEGHRVTFEMEGEENPDTIPGDLVIALFSKPHPRFKRRRNGLDLDTTLEITLKEAMLGFEKQFTHLDDKEVVTVSKEGVTPFGTVVKIPGKGMPKHHVPSERGDLYVAVEFKLPPKLTEEQRQLLEKVL